jgi:hypothetical protein
VFARLGGRGRGVELEEKTEGMGEDLLGECRALLVNVVVHSDVSDRWQWDPNPHEGYTVRGAYQALTSMEKIHCCRRRRSHLAQTGPFEGFHPCMAFDEGQVTNPK